MSKKLYAVKKGVVPGIYKTWSDCEKQVNGYPGATYKSFSSEEEAISYLNGESEPIIEKDIDTGLEVYVDGSFNALKEQYGWGFVLVNNGESISTGKGTGHNASYIGNHQVAGEIISVIEGVKRAIYKGYKNVCVVYDYEGVEKWMTGDWQAKSKIAQAYIYYMIELQKKIDISFKKVKAHSGNKFNDIADKLAKEGANK